MTIFVFCFRINNQVSPFVGCCCCCCCCSISSSYASRKVRNTRCTYSKCCVNIFLSLWGWVGTFRAQKIVGIETRERGQWRRLAEKKEAVQARRISFKGDPGVPALDGASPSEASVCSAGEFSQPRREKQKTKTTRIERGSCFVRLCRNQPCGP